MESGLRLRPCVRNACETRRAQSSTGSCCDGHWVCFHVQEPPLNCILQREMPRRHRRSVQDAGRHKSNGTTRAITRTGLLHTLAQWRAALERAECLCAEMRKMGRPPCCVEEVLEISSAKDLALTRPKQCCPTAAIKGTKAPNLQCWTLGLAINHQPLEALNSRLAWRHAAPLRQLQRHVNPLRSARRPLPPLRLVPR